MAEPLSSEGTRSTGPGHNGAPIPCTQVQYENWKKEYDQKDKAVLEATGERKDLRARIKGVIGKNGMKAFDQARSLALMPGADRVEIDEHVRRMLECENKPLGHQAGFPGFDMSNAPPPAMLNLDDEEIEAIKRQGYDAGRAGKAAARNPWNPGSKPHEIWLEAWTNGQAEKVERELGTGSANGSTAPKRGPGRPKGPAKASASARPKRVISEAQKAAMKAGREAAAARKKTGAGSEPLQ